MENLEALADRLLKEDAERLGMSYTDYCNKLGILGPVQQQSIRRHEIQLKDVIGE